jgi:hypothetical protein
MRPLYEWGVPCGMKCRSTFIQNGYLHTNTEYFFNNLFSQLWAIFVTRLLFFHEALLRGTKETLSSSHAMHAPRTDNGPLLRARRKISSLSGGSPSFVGDIASSSGLRQPQLVLLTSEKALPRRAKGAPPLLKTPPPPLRRFL